MEDDEAEGKEGEDEGVFLGFGDDGAMDANAQALIRLIRRKSAKNRVARPVAGVSVLRPLSERVGQDKVANGLVG